MYNSFEKQDIRSRFLKFVGVNSLLFYFLEIPAKYFLCINFIDNYWLFTIAAIIVTSVIVLIYNHMKTITRLKYCFSSN